MNQTKSNSLKSRTEHVYNGEVYVHKDNKSPNCDGCDLFSWDSNCMDTNAECGSGIFKKRPASDLIYRIAILLDTASFETEGDVTTAYIPLHYSGIMDDVLEMMKITSTMGTFKEKSSFLRAYNIHTSDFKRICEKH